MKIRIFRRDLIMMMKIWEHVIPSVKNDRICDDIAKWRCHHCVTVQMFQVSFETFHENVVSWLTKISTMIPEILFMKWYLSWDRLRRDVWVGYLTDPERTSVLPDVGGRHCPFPVLVWFRPDFPENRVRCLSTVWILPGFLTDVCLSGFIGLSF